MLNRGAIFLRYKEPALRWINGVDQTSPEHKLSLAEVNRDRPIYLISDYDADSEKTVNAWIQANYRDLFEDQLDSWQSDEALWPGDRTLKLFHSWFAVEHHSIVIDTVEEPIVDDDAEPS